MRPNDPKSIHNLFGAVIGRLFFLMCYIILLLGSSRAVADECFSEATHQRAQSSHPLVAITAHYSELRLQYLSQVLTSLGTFPHATVIIYTNTVDETELSNLKHVCSDALAHRNEDVSWSIRSCPNLLHEYFLTWEHKPAIKDEFVQSGIYSHFIYLEDDEELTFDNFLYFLEYRERLRSKNLLPAFLRVEYHKGLNDFTSTDQLSPVQVSHCPHFALGDLIFINLYLPYMGCFILDQELAEEYVNSLSFDINQSCQRTGWPIRERAAAGLCWENIPPGFRSRYVVAADKNSGVPPRYIWIRHLPNNYADLIHVEYGKTPMRNLFVW